MEESEHTVLSRIRYPDRRAALLYGEAHHALDDGGQDRKKSIKRRETDITLGKSNYCRHQFAIKFGNV